MFKRIWFLAPIGVFAALHCAQAQAQAQACAAGGPPCVYSVKFICGDEAANPNLHAPSEPPVKPGNYATAINIHNFHSEPVNITKSAVIAVEENPPNQPKYVPINPQVFGVPLPAGQAFEIDCSDIVTLLGPQPAPLPPFTKGFVVLRVSSSGISPTLSVTAVYTAQAAAAATGPSGPISIAVVPVQPFVGP